MTQLKNTKEAGGLRLLSVAQTADLLNLSPLTVRRHLISGRLFGIKYGRRWLVPEESLVATIERLPRNTTTVGR